MKNTKYITIFLIAFFGALGSLLIAWNVFIKDFHFSKHQTTKISCAYEEIDLVLPVKAFLKRCAGSSQLSYVRGVLVDQWISSNQDDLISLVVYGQGAMQYPELKKALLAGIEKEKQAKGAASFITNAFKIIDENPDLVTHVNTSLKEGYDQSIHVLRGNLMNLDPESREYKKLKNDYKKALDHWIDKKHGALLDQIIAKL